METSSKKDTLVVAWYVPELARTETFRGGKKKLVLDLFGPWAPFDDLTAEAVKRCRLPSPLVHLQSILECNFEFTDIGGLPHDVFVALRLRHGIDMTGFNSSMTQRGNMYRSYVLMRG